MNEIGFNISNDFKRMEKILHGLQTDVIQKAKIRALNRTAERVKEHTVRQVLPKYIDRPTRWTLNSVMVRNASRKGGMEARVLFKDWRYVAKSASAAADYLDPMIEGGDRRPKNFERRLKRSGLIRKDQFALPGGDIRLDRFGNIPARVSDHILRDLKAYNDGGYDRNTKRQALKYFLLPRYPHKPIGVYWRQGGKLKQAIVFAEDAPNYEARLPFYLEAQKMTVRVISEEFREAAQYYAARMSK
ncbi:hypothetical protein DN730_09845 [Marinomonas piezotolerans]|uniref:Uncharacterized protein n=1 Tax=Marinomonas piezotolerans TaxID=2213058 RepID=A0A370UA99_9GAMM|nr:hypothetical protein [Marinomonas piezotolerans]RDL44678.1 hypothetical protein DN730_09845 [Marinomonas piezotolerans]